MPRAIRSISAVTLLFILVVVLGGLAFLLLPIDLGDGMRSRGDFLAPLLSAAALLVSGIALIASVRTAGAGFRAEEKVKEDIATLLTALRNLRLRLHLAGYLLGAAADDLLDLIVEQRRVIDSINNSTTGYALIVFEGERSRAAGDKPSEWRILQMYLLETLESSDPAVVFARAVALEKLLETLTARDIRRLAGFVSDLAASTTLFRDSYGVFDTIDKEPERSEKEDEPSNGDSADGLLARFRRIKARGVDDPDVDMFIAVLEGDGSADALKEALERGANPRVTDTEVLRRHDD